MSVEPPGYPVFLRLAGRCCLVVGGGTVAWRKISGLLEAGARVVVVAPDVSAAVAAAAGKGELELRLRSFREGDLDGVFLVYAATDAPALNARILALARERSLLAAAVDGNWRNGDFLTPARLRCAGATIAISTGGRSCTRARDLKEEIGRLLAARYGEAEDAGEDGRQE